MGPPEYAWLGEAPAWAGSVVAALVSIYVAVSVAVGLVSALLRVVLSGVGRGTVSWGLLQPARSSAASTRDVTREWGLGMFIGLGALSCDVFVQGFG